MKKTDIRTGELYAYTHFRGSNRLAWAKKVEVLGFINTKGVKVRFVDAEELVRGRYVREAVVSLATIICTWSERDVEIEQMHKHSALRHEANEAANEAYAIARYDSEKMFKLVERGTVWQIIYQKDDGTSSAVVTLDKEMFDESAARGFLYEIREGYVSTAKRAAYDAVVQANKE